jgi:diguanylate cyclase (GGDEF)-like protein
VGDQVLREVAAAIAKLLRGTDFAGRLGGDEFGVLLVETTADGPEVFFGRLHDALNAVAARHAWPLGISVGVGVFHPPPITPDDAIRFADALMYQVKHSGKNRVLIREFVVVASPS